MNQLPSLRLVISFILVTFFMMACQNTSSEFRESNASSDFEEPTQRVILLLDLSGSMRGTPLKQLKKFAHQVIDSTLEYNTQVAIRGFSTNCQMPFSVQQNFTQNADQLHYCIDSLKANGNTPLVEAIEKTIQETLQIIEPNEHILIYLVSDGKPTCSTLQQKIQEFLTDERIIFYIIGYGIEQLSDFARQLQTLSNSSGGEYMWMAAGASITAFSVYQQHQNLRHQNETYREQVIRNGSRYNNQNTRSSSSGVGK